MTNEFDAFLKKASEITEAQTNSDMLGAERGFVMVTAREIGMHFPIGTPRHVTQARIFEKPTDTPAGHALWQKQSDLTQARLAALVSEETEPAKESTFNPNLTINRS